MKTINSLITHIARKYKLNSEQIYCEINNILENLLCKYVYGEKFNFETFTLEYGFYKHGQLLFFVKNAMKKT